MKGSIIAGMLLFMLALLLIFNSLYVHHVTNQLSDMEESLPERLPRESPQQTIATIEKIQAYLKKHEVLLGISVSYTSIDRMTELSLTLTTCVHLHAEYDYTATRALLIDAIDDAARLEKLSARNIF